MSFYLGSRFLFRTIHHKESKSGDPAMGMQATAIHQSVAIDTDEVAFTGKTKRKIVYKYKIANEHIRHAI